MGFVFLKTGVSLPKIITKATLLVVTVFVYCGASPGGCNSFSKQPGARDINFSSGSSSSSTVLGTTGSGDSNSLGPGISGSGESGASEANGANETTAETCLSVYRQKMEPVLQLKCATCHNESQAFGGYGFRIGSNLSDSDLQTNYINAVFQTEPGNGEISADLSVESHLIYSKAIGVAHGGGSIIASDSVYSESIKSWLAAEKNRTCTK